MAKVRGLWNSPIERTATSPDVEHRQDQQPMSVDAPLLLEDGLTTMPELSAPPQSQSVPGAIAFPIDTQVFQGQLLRQQDTPSTLGQWFPPEFGPRSSPRNPIGDKDTPHSPVLPDPGYTMSDIARPASLCCVGYNHETNDLVAIITVPQGSGTAGLLCDSGLLLYVGFFLFNNSFPPITVNGSPQTVLFIGNASVRVYDVSAVPSTPLHYEVTLPLDSSDEETLSQILKVIQDCRRPFQVTPELSSHLTQAGVDELPAGR
jgi:hypothetical protein